MAWSPLPDDLLLDENTFAVGSTSISGEILNHLPQDMADLVIAYQDDQYAYDLWYLDNDVYSTEADDEW